MNPIQDPMGNPMPASEAMPVDALGLRLLMAKPPKGEMHTTSSLSNAISRVATDAINAGETVSDPQMKEAMDVVIKQIELKSRNNRGVIDALALVRKAAGLEEKAQ